MLGSGVDIGFLFYGLVYYVSMVDRDLCRTVYVGNRTNSNSVKRI